MGAEFCLSVENSENLRVTDNNQRPTDEGVAVEPPQLVDDRRPARGWGRLVPAVFWLAGVATTVIAVMQLVREPSGPLGPKLVTLFAGVLYLLAALGLTHNGRRMRAIAWVSVWISAGGPIIVGLMGLGQTWVGGWSPWSQFGMQVWFTSLVLPIVGIVWLWASNPRRITQLAESGPRR